MIDVQSQQLLNGRKIDRVGVKGLRYPIVVKDKKFGRQSTVASINMYVALPEEDRGTHMSRFLEIIGDVAREDLNRATIRSALLKIKKSLKARAAHIEFFFPYFIDQQAPVSGIASLMEHECGLYGTHNEHDHFSLTLEINTIVMNLCPCSRELSPGKSAHNQRSRVTVKLRTGPLIWIEDIVEIIEQSASSPVYPLLKRIDEKYVMDNAHDKPRFVEDIVREIAGRLEQVDGIKWYSVESENFESIHHHNVYARIEKHVGR